MEATDHTVSDEALMLRLREGDDAALAEIMQRWERPVKRFIFRMVGNASEAADLAQETFVRVYFRRSTFRPGSKFSAWLFTIAANLSKNRLRWWKRRPNLSLNAWMEAGGDQPDETLAPDMAVAVEERATTQAARVHRAVATLPVDQRTALVLFEFEDRAMDEIAVIMGSSAKAVENRLYRARRALRGLLGGPDTSD